MEQQGKVNQKILHKHSGDDWIFLDEALLRNIIFNLLSNAQKFSSEIGKIQINTSINEAILKIEVKDNGIGISKKRYGAFDRTFF
jgi:signal transduction histidine kinase